MEDKQWGIGQKLDEFDVNLGLWWGLTIYESDDTLDLKPGSADAIKFHALEVMPHDCHGTFYLPFRNTTALRIGHELSHRCLLNKIWTNFVINS